jgi:hypothetical protein
MIFRITRIEINMKNMIKYILSLTLILVSLALSACLSSSPASVTYFPIQKEVELIVLQSILPGELVLDDANYLRVDNNLIIWPYGYSLKIEGKDIWIIDDKNQPAVMVGDWVKIGGGFVLASFAEEKIGHPLPVDCVGPYWLAGGVSKTE